MKRKGFTLVELMIVVAILGILGAIVMPQYANSSQQAADSATKSMLYTVRSQIELYKMQHAGLNPGYWGTVGITGTSLTNQFIGTSKLNGVSTSSTTPSGDYVYGPYLMKMPKNPFNSLSNIKIVSGSVTDFATAVDDTTGWLYQRETAIFKVNKSGTDSEGNAYIDY